MKKYLLSLSILVLFVSCTSKQFYQGEQTSSIKTNIISTPTYIKSFNTSGATLDDNRYIDKIGISKDRLKEGFSFVNNSNSNIISANKKGELYINKDKHFQFKSNVISASLKDNILALIFSNNTVALYDINTKQFKLRKFLEASYLNDTRIAMPLFINELILLPTLNGKVLIVNNKNFKVEKTLIIDPSSEVNNIILLKSYDETLIVASQNVIMSFNNTQALKKELFIQSYTLDKENIYLASLEGKILKLDKNLNILKSKKYKFAKFQALAINKTDLLAIESQGFIIKLSHDFTKEKIDKISFEDDEKAFTMDNKIYFEDKLLTFL